MILVLKTTRIILSLYGVTRSTGFLGGENTLTDSLNRHPLLTLIRYQIIKRVRVEAAQDGFYYYYELLNHAMERKPSPDRAIRLCIILMLLLANETRLIEQLDIAVFKLFKITRKCTTDNFMTEKSCTDFYKKDALEITPEAWN